MASGSKFKQTDGEIKLKRGRSALRGTQPAGSFFISVKVKVVLVNVIIISHEIVLGHIKNVLFYIS